ncbi:thioredoxin domain-containing protein [Patescibacteria group bacterium]|nr:thioredoxin domain-containing protein [Patescibacteria group bacterium]MBU2159204.1 thioredoxin domain-containing protein [Patescibacteria group bacterium]MBU2220605.1 thioredoxin domain-containing protein [Patescibacteria group bacterium]
METNAQGSFMERYLTPIAVVLGCVIIAVAIAFGQGGTKNAPNDGQAMAVDIKDVDTDSSPYVGEKNAPVVMAVWYDYQCPFCKQFELGTTAEVYENYVKDGKVKIVFKDFQFLDEYSKNPERMEDSMTAAVFGRAVWDAYPDRFYDWFRAMAEAQDDEFDGFGDYASIEALTRTISGIDGDRVIKLVSDKRAEYEAAIAADRAEGQALGINGTPSLIIGTTLLSGAQPYDAVKALIDAELK